jgi:hypothetical protein
MLPFPRLWFLGIVRPSAAFHELDKKPAPQWGFVSILVRFIVTALTSILALQLLSFRPFVPSYLTLLEDANYYRAEVFFLPIFGVAAWLLSSALVHLILRISRQKSDIDRIMNVIGFSLLVVMPLVWLLDWTGIAFGFYGSTYTIPIHALVSVWEIALMGIGFNQMLRLRWPVAVLLGLIVKAGVYIPLAALFIR